jgi:hypothetical protein
MMSSFIYSPTVHTPQAGKMLTFLYLSAAFHMFPLEPFRYVREVVGASDAVLGFQVEIDSISVNGVDLLKWNDAPGQSQNSRSCRAGLKPSA